MGLTLEEANRILRGVIARHRRLLLNLKARYAALCDAQYDADGIAMLFTEDTAAPASACGVIGDGIRPRKSGSHRTPRWSGMNSNFQCRAR